MPLNAIERENTKKEPFHQLQLRGWAHESCLQLIFMERNVKVFIRSMTEEGKQA